jgi:ABC-type sugar transport system substrate-binding protein
MKNGIISATIAQNVEDQMEKAFEMLVKHIITGEECPETVYTDVQLVLKSNIHQFE